MIRHDVCPLCRSSGIALHLNSTDHLVSGEVFPLKRCQACNFVFTDDYPSEDESGRYYESEDYISHTDTGRNFFEKTYRSVRVLMLKRKIALVRKVTGLRQGRILDIGSGTGHFLARMKSEGWHATGIEINSSARNYANSRFSLETKAPEHISGIEAESADCITLWHVLEHFHHPFSYMEEIRRILKTGGTLIVALPNIRSSDSLHYGHFWAAWDVPRHLWHFSPSTFRMFAERSGFKVTGLKRLPFDVFYISILSEKHRGSRFSLIKGAIKGIWFSVPAMFRKDKSSSLIYILQPSTDL